MYGFDSFKGLPEDWSKEMTVGMFDRNGIPPEIDNSNIQFVIGLFQDTLEKFLETHKESIAFLHIDCDLYSSTKYVLSSLKDRIISGTVILFDEIYGHELFDNNEGKAFEEFLEESGKKFEFLCSASCQVAMRIL